MLLPLIAGVLLGFFGSIPAAGPLAVLIYAAGMAGDRRRLTALALGGAVAEGLWAFAAASGLGFLLTHHPVVSRWLAAWGGLLLVAVGILLLVAPARLDAALRERREPGSAALFGFAIVALNPSFLASWMGSCAVLGSVPSLAVAVSPEHAGILAAGAVAGVLAWFCLLGLLLARLRERLHDLHGHIVRGFGGVLLALGVVHLLSEVF